MIEILDRSEKLRKLIQNNKKIIIDILTKYESYETAINEIKQSLKCLENISSELKYLSYKKVQSISVFFPINLPLYSFILFGVMPGFMSDKITIRASKYNEEVLKRIIKTLKINTLFKNIKIVEDKRKNFMKKYVSNSEVIIFTGKYENILKIKRKFKSHLIIYSGLAVNPIIVTPSAELKSAVNKIISARIFNSGQDCAGPDTILVHSKIKKRFLEILIKNLSKVKIGEYYNKKVRIGKTIDPKAPLFIQKIFKENKKDIIYGGKVNTKKNIIFPTIIVKSIKDKQNYTEFFSPIFFVTIYNSKKDLNLYLKNKDCWDFRMYLTIFGDKLGIDDGGYIVLKNKILLEFEEGNKEYGGYGKKANFICFENKSVSKPILISKEIHNWLKRRIKTNKTLHRSISLNALIY